MMTVIHSRSPYGRPLCPRVLIAVLFASVLVFGCSGGSSSDLDAGVDAASTPDATPIDPCAPDANGVIACSPTCLCEHGQGNCTVEADCVDGLTCIADIGDLFGMDADVDVCVPPGDGVAPSVTIAFPMHGSLTDADSLAVFGSATDVDGIARISVNGVEATLSSVDVGVVDWRVRIPLTRGVNSVTVESADLTGAVDSGAAQFDVRSDDPLLRRPDGMAIDEAAGKGYYMDIIDNALVEFELATGARRVVSSNMFESGDGLSRVHIDKANQRILATVSGSNDRLIAVDIASGTQSMISNAGQGTGLGFSVPLGLLYESGNDRVLIVDRGRRALIGVNMTTGDRTYISDAANGSGPTLEGPYDLVLNEANSHVLVVDSSKQALFSIDLTTGARTVLSDATTGTGPGLSGAVGLGVDFAANRAYVANIVSDALLAIDLTSGDRTIVSDTATGSGPGFQDPRAMALTGDGATVWISFTVWNTPVSGVMSIDLASGARTAVIEDRVGSGEVVFGSPLSLIRDPASARLMTPYGSSQFQIRTLDTTNGARAFLFSNDEIWEDDDFDSYSMAISSDGAHLYVPRRFTDDDTFEGTIITVDIAAEQAAVIYDDSTGTGPDLTRPTWLELDEAGGRIIGVDTNLGGVFAIDLTTKDRIIVSSNNVGSGPSLGGGGPLKLDLENQRALVLNGDLVAVDLMTGDRSTISVGDDSTMGPTFDRPRDLALDLDNNRVLVPDSGLYAMIAVDLTSGMRTIIADDVNLGEGPSLSAPAAIELDATGQIAFLSADSMEAVLAVDVVSGDRVVISR